MKKFYTPTHSSLSKSKPPLFLDEKLAYMFKTLEELQDNLVQEITVTDNLEQNYSKVIFKQNFQTHSRQIYALKSAVEGLNKSIFENLETLYSDIKVYANREIALLVPKIEASGSKVANLEKYTNKNSNEVEYFRKELNDRYEFLLNKINEVNLDCKDIKELQVINKKEISLLKSEFSAINENFNNFEFQSNHNIKTLSEKTNQIVKNFEDLDAKIDKKINNFSNEIKRNNTLLRKSIDEVDEKYEKHINKIKNKVLEQSNEIGSIEHLVNTFKDKILEIKSDIDSKYEELFENLQVDIKKIYSSIGVLTNKFDRSSEISQTNLDEINKSFNSRLEAISKTLMNEIKMISERIYKGERDFDIFKREILST
jgi:predicted  nucleic acid-binding Zn-ribbon protein